MQKKKVKAPIETHFEVFPELKPGLRTTRNSLRKWKTGQNSDQSRVQTTENAAQPSQALAVEVDESVSEVSHRPTPPQVPIKDTTQPRYLFTARISREAALQFASNVSLSNCFSSNQAQFVQPSAQHDAPVNDAIVAPPRPSCAKPSLFPNPQACH